MNNSKALQQYLLAGITLSESQGEIESVAYALLEHYFQVTHTDVIRDKPIMVSQEQKELIDGVLQRINAHEPVQYVTGEAYFFRRSFRVTKDVLIPRPETEELIVEVLAHVKRKGLHQCRILDLGTGSGCIPVTLALEIPKATVMATDISENALTVARENAERYKSSIQFYLHDMLSEEITLTDLDIVTSNPPYIRDSERLTMQRNVLDYEPQLALFVPDDDPLRFYKVIVEKAKNVLRSGGMLIVEINEHFGHAVSELFTGQGYTHVEIVYDLSQKARIVRGIKEQK